MSSSAEETRFWPRVGLYVTRASAAGFIERMGGTGHALDEDLEEFVSPSMPDPKSLAIEIEDLFKAPYEAQELSTENMAILNLMQFESDKKKFIMEKKYGHEYQSDYKWNPFLVRSGQYNGFTIGFIKEN